MGWTRTVLGLLAVAGVGTAAVYFSGQRQDGVRSVLAAPGPIRLGKESVEIHLKPVQSSTALHSLLGTLKPDEKLYLVLHGLRLDRQPGVVFQIFLGPRSEKQVPGREKRLLGTFNFFSVPETPEPSTASAEKTTRTFEITQAMKDLPAAASELLITIQPSGPPSANSAPAIGTAEVVIAR